MSADKQSGLKDAIGKILRDALSGQNARYRTPDGFTRWGTVQNDMDAAIDAAFSSCAALEPQPPNAAGETMCHVRWMVETPAGWLGAWDKGAFAAYAAACASLPESGRTVLQALNAPENAGVRGALPAPAAPTPRTDDAIMQEIECRAPYAEDAYKDRLRKGYLKVVAVALEEASRSASAAHWEEEARRYAQNADFWRAKYESALSATEASKP